MKPWARACLGIAVGVFLALAIHPISRPFLLLPIWPTKPNVILSEFDTSGRLAPPKSLLEASLWVQLGSEKLWKGGGSLSRREAASIVKVAEAAHRREPDNGYWLQMNAVFRANLGDTNGAKSAWFQASRCRSWNDYQSARLLKGQERLAGILGGQQSWTTAVAYFQRSTTMAKCVAQYAEGLLATAGVFQSPDLLLRSATLRNGTLIREGARALNVGRIGSAIVEAASYPPDVQTALSQRRLWLARTQLVSRLRERSFLVDADLAEKSFQENDAWILLTGTDEFVENSRQLASTAIVLGPLPGLLLSYVAVLLVVGSLLNALVPRWNSLRFFRNGSVITIAALTAASSVLLSRNWSGALIGGACVAFLTFGPIHPRRRTSDDLGPLLIFLVVCIWLTSLTAFLIAGISATAPAQLLLSDLGQVGTFLDRTEVFRGSSLMASSMLCVTATSYALVHRFATPDILGLVLRRFCWIAGVGTMTLAVILIPVCIGWDLRTSDDLQRLVMNEPVYYLTQ